MLNIEAKLNEITSSDDVTISELNHMIEKANEYEWLYNHRQIIAIIAIIVLIIGILSLICIYYAEGIFEKIFIVVAIITLYLSISSLMSLYDAKKQIEKRDLLIEQRQDLKDEQQQKQKAKELKQQPLQHGKVQSVKLSDKTIQIKINQHNYQSVDKFQEPTTTGLANDVSKGSQIKYKTINDKINIKEVEK